MSEGHVQAVVSGGAIHVSGPPAGFGVAVNSTLNHYVSVADTKAGSVVAAALAILAVRGRGAAPLGDLNHMTVILASLGALLCGLLAVFPRLPKGRQGVLFWEDIRNYGTADAYTEAVKVLSAPTIEVSYAHQNFHVAGLLHNKMRLVRWSILFLAIALAAVAWNAWGL